MGIYCYKDIDYILENFAHEKGYIIWIDENVNNEENQKYVTKIKNPNFTIDTFINIESGLNKIYEKGNNFKNIYLFLGDSIYIDFILTFKNNLKDMYVVPKIVVFTKDKELFLKKNSNIKDIIENKFYSLGGIQTIGKDALIDFIIEKKWKKNYIIEKKSLNNDIEGEQYTFEYIEDIKELYLPVFYKALIKLNKKDIFEELTHYLLDKYKNDKNNIKELLEPIDGIPDIPIEILCKYYARLYTMESEFYNDLNERLRKGNLLFEELEKLFSANKNNYYSITFIKSFYEGIKLNCFKFDLKDKLYRFSRLAQKEIDKIKIYLDNKKLGIPAANLYSKTFLSFSEDKEVANGFYNTYMQNKTNNDKNLVPVFFHLIKKEDIKESLYTHMKIDNISVFPDEKEILFLPFTCFEILSITPTLIGEKEKEREKEREREKEKEKKRRINNNRNIVEYYTIELTYLGKYEKELKNIEKEEKIPDTGFRTAIEQSNLVEIDEDITNKRLIDEFNEYEKSFRRNNKDIYILYDVKEEDIDKDHYVSIFGRNLEENGTDFVKENKEKIKILINNEEKTLEYKYKLEIGYNKIVIKLNSDEIFNLGYMFCGCTSLIKIEGLKYLDTKNITNFSKMFYGCKSLLDIKALENWNVSNVNNFEGMFAECKSLKDITALQNWNVSNGNNFSNIFYGCESLSDIKSLEKWDVSNGNNFSGIFNGSKSLSDIKVLENWNVSNGKDFSGIFNGCKSLSDIKPLEKWDVSNGNNFSKMFYGCESLTNIKSLENWNVSNGINFSGIFRECKSLSDIKPLEKWDVANGNNFSQLFYLCNSLSDIKPLENWNVSKGNDFSGMFCQCKLLSNIKPLENWNVPKRANFYIMFSGCDSLSDYTPIDNWKTEYSFLLMTNNNIIRLMNDN